MLQKKLLQKNRKNKQSGFTLMETLVAIFILLLALTGPMVFAQYGLRSAFLARDQITAFFLAQDAIEYIKNVRNGNVVSIIKSEIVDSDGWLNYGSSNLFDNVVCGTVGCTIDTMKKNIDGLGTVDSCNTSSSPGCVNDDDLNDYTPLNYYQSGDESYFTTREGSNINPSIFSREIKIKEIKHTQIDDTEQDNIEAEITVFVRWRSNEGIGVREIVVRENITNWAHALLSAN